ncbi:MULTISPECIES: hypothetical protein [unclassified Clostridium]|uniref:hypothetical protein n=2 Tax=Clostridium TaxID=1485 RepID=UPI001C8BE08A|nr:MULTISPECIES: hypothetical protein [unclassified Clostridium]MBX9137823.1 hypothetical protein [Clostridium sp. K12(2020)]MBX9143522.1 hypothetical protein [Clostridium sp. K13]MDU4326057.1 hypothetical protein [Clostridium celatum]
MFKFKKDWLRTNRSFFLFSFIPMVFLAIIFLFIRNINGKIFWEVNYEIVDRLVMMGTMFVCFIPLMSFGYIFPTSEKSFSGKIKVNHLPFSNKQLAWKGIKMWLLAYPMWIVIGSFVSVLYEYRAMSHSITTMASSFSISSLEGLVLFNISKIIILSIFMMIIDMQIIGSMIICFAKEIKWYIIFIVQLLINGGLIAGTVFFIVKSNIDTGLNSIEGFIPVIILFSLLFIVSLIYFLYSIKDIEKVYR